MSAAADLLERIRRALPPPSLSPLTPLSSRALSFFSPSSLRALAPAAA
jgi:hypothetical protein